MSQPPDQHHDYKSSSSSSTSTSSSSSTDAITSTLAQLELEQERPYHYSSSSQYAYLSNDVTTRSMGGVNAFTEPPIFRSTDVSNLNHDQYRNEWQTSSTGAKELNVSSGYTRDTDAQHMDPKSYTTSYTTTSTSSSSSSTTLSLHDELRASLKDIIPLDNPGYVEACYHFKFTMSPVELYITLLKILDQLHVDTSIPDMKQYKIVCRSYHDGMAIPFIVRIWKPVRDDNAISTEYWCEFQRRSGDILYFSELYHQCVKAVSTGDIESACIPSRTILPGIDDVVASPDEMADTLKCLMQMAASPCHDIKAQAILSLSELSSQDDMVRDLIIQHGGLETFLKSLMNTSEDVQRGATSALANLAQGTHADRVASTFTADASRLARLSYNANASQQLIRESARALYNIGMALGASRCDATFRNTVKSFHATDPQAKQHIHRLLTQLQIC